MYSNGDQHFSVHMWFSVTMSSNLAAHNCEGVFGAFMHGVIDLGQYTEGELGLLPAK